MLFYYILNISVEYSVQHTIFIFPVNYLLGKNKNYIHIFGQLLIDTSSKQFLFQSNLKDINGLGISFNFKMLDQISQSSLCCHQLPKLTLRSCIPGESGIPKITSIVEMTQSIKRSPCKHEHLSLIPEPRKNNQNKTKENPSTVMYVCHLSTGEVETGWQVLERHWSAHLF